MISNKTLLAIYVFGSCMTGCGAGSSWQDLNQPIQTAAQSQNFTIRLDNVAPFTNLKTGSFSTKVGGSAPGPLAPGDSFSFSFTAGLHSRFTFTSMFGESNDWFFSTNAMGIPLFENGMPISGDITSQVSLWDAGTQINEEPAVGPHTGPNRATSTDGPGAPDPNPLVRIVGSPTVLTSGKSFNTPLTASMIKVSIASYAPTRFFTVTITNVATDNHTLITSEGPKPVRLSPGVWAIGTGNEPIFTDGTADRGEGLKQQAESGDNSGLATTLPTHSGVATALSPGVWVVHQSGTPLFVTGARDFGNGLTAIAEMGNNAPLSASLAQQLPRGASAYGTFATPIGSSTPGPIAPGAGYEFQITARPGDILSLATMFGFSDDWFFAPADTGIPLFDGQTAVSGDVSADMQLWNDGAELSEPPEVGPNVGSPTGAPADPLGTVRLITTDEYSTPVTEHLRLTITP